MTCTAGACLAYSLAAHSSAAGDVVDLERHHGHSPAMGVLAMFVGIAFVVVWEKLLMGCLLRGSGQHHSSGGAREHAHGEAVDIARSLSCCLCIWLKVMG